MRTSSLLGLASLAVATSLGGCTVDSTDLTSLGHPTLGIAEYTGGNSYEPYVMVTVDYDGFANDDKADCAALAVDATFDGSAFTDAVQGGWHEAGWNDPPDATSHCIQPSFTMNELSPGPATIHIADASAAFDVALPDLVAARSLSFPDSPGFELHNGSAVTLTPSIPATDTPDGFVAYGASPAANTEQPDGDYCGEALFQANVSASAGYQLPIMLDPDFSSDSSCTSFLSGPLVADVQLFMYTVPQITTCSGGAACTALVTAESDLTTTFVP